MSDKKYNRLGYTGLGTGMQDRLIKGAYLSARAGSPDYSWMNVVSGGIKSFKEEVDTAKANKKAAREETLAGIQTTVDSIYETGGSLPQKYFDQAYEYTKQLREEYVAAIESGDTKAQHQIKGKLNAFSTSIQTTKTSLTEGASLWKDSSLIDENGMTDYQLAVNASFKEENAQLVDGVYQWANVNHDPTNPNSKEFFTLDDYKKALPLRDDVNKEVYLKDGQNVLDAREKWLNGDGGEFDVNTQRKKNMKIIEDSSSDSKGVGSIQSMLHDDITGQGSFASSFDDDKPHPEYEKFFENIMTEDGLENVKMIGLHDKSDDGIVGYEDFIDFNSPEALSMFPEFGAMDLNKDGIISNEELLTVIKSNPSIEEDIKGLIRPKIKDALLNVDNPNYNEDLTKNMLADFMTNRQRQMFYGGDETYKNLLPNPGGRRADSENYYRKGKLVINGEEITSLDQYKEMGGSYQYLKDQGYSWDKKDGKWVKTKPTFESKEYKGR